jgi:RNA polymerase sigma factor (TIGR02999 family)
MSDDGCSQITKKLHEVSSGEAQLNSLVPYVYEQLRLIANQRMSKERKNHTLQATALVHEVFVRIQGDQKIEWENRNHFYAAAAEAMRRILIDHARKKKSQKRGAGQVPLPLNVVDLAENFALDDVLAVNEAIDKLESEDAQAAQIVKLRFYAGLSVEEAAKSVGISERTAYREWTYARTRLFEMLNDNE